MLGWDTELAAERAAEALDYLARYYPECGGSRVLQEHDEAADEAAASSAAGDLEAYLEALRAFMRAGRAEALRIRKGAA